MVFATGIQAVNDGITKSFMRKNVYYRISDLKVNAPLLYRKIKA